FEPPCLAAVDFESTASTVPPLSQPGRSYRIVAARQTRNSLQERWQCRAVRLTIADGQPHWRALLCADPGAGDGDERDEAARTRGAAAGVRQPGLFWPDHPQRERGRHRFALAGER